MIFEKIEAIKQEIGPVVRDSEGHGFEYAGLSLIKQHLDPLIEKHQLAMIITKVKISENNVYSFVVYVKDREDGENCTLSFDCYGDTVKSRDKVLDPTVQQSGSTYSYMQRYIKKVIFDLDFIDDDPDHVKNSSKSNSNNAPNDSGVNLVTAKMKEKGMNATDVIALSKKLFNNDKIKSLNGSEITKLLAEMDKK